MALSEKQEEILRILDNNQDNPLKLSEIQELANLSSPGHVHHYLSQLEKKGYLKRNPNNSRDYTVMFELEAAVLNLNLYGSASCGPNGTLLSGNPIDRIPIYRNFIKFDSNNAFLLKAKGNSMEPRIHNNDIVICKAQNIAEPGDTIVCTYEEETRIKIFRPINSEIIILESTNKDYAPIAVTSPNFSIDGIFKGVICSHE